LEAWFAIGAVSWSPTTIVEHRSVLRCYLLPRLGDVRVGDVTASRINRLYVTLRASGSRTGGPLAPSTLKRVRSALHSVFGLAMREGWIWDNPVTRADQLKHARSEVCPPTLVELDRLLTFLGDRKPTMQLFVALAANTGARRAQMLGLRWHNVGRDYRSVSFTAGWVDGPGGPVLAPTKPKRAHRVDIDSETAARLRQYARTHRGKDNEGFIFSDDRGATAWKPNRVSKAFSRYLRAAGLRPFRLHDLRHFMATEMLEAKVSVVAVSRRLDHRRTSTTLDFYAHAVPGADTDAAEILGKIMYRRAS
jgi:integrase